MNVPSLPARFLQLSTPRFLLDALMVWVCFGLVAYGVALTHQPWAWGLGVVLVGLLQNALSILGHDAVHYRICPNRALNDLLTRLLITSAIAFPLTTGRKNHLKHHQHLGNPLDQDRHYHQTAGKETPRKFLGFLLGSLCLGFVVKIVLKMLHPQERIASGDDSTLSCPSSSSDIWATMLDFALIALAQGVLWLALYRLSGHWWTYLVLWLLPLLTLSMFLNSVRSFAEHARPIPDVEADQNRLITHTSSKLERMIIAPFYMNFHAEHHLYMPVPYYHLPELHCWLKQQNFDNPIQYKSSYYGSVWDFLRGI